MALNPWGTSGSPWDGLRPSGDDEYGGPLRKRGGNLETILGRRSVDIDGTNYYRLGGPAEDFAQWRAYDSLAPNITYDPTYGYIAPTDIFNRAQGESYTGGGSSIFDDPIVKALTDGKHGGHQEILQNAPVVAGAALTAGGAAGLAGYGPLAAGAASGSAPLASAGGIAALGETALPAVTAGGAEAFGAAPLFGAAPVAGAPVVGAGGALGATTLGGIGGAETGLMAGAAGLGAVSGIPAGEQAYVNQITDQQAQLLGNSLGGGGAAASGTALSRIIDGTASNSDWAQVLGTGVATGLGMFGANQQANSLEGIMNRVAAERKPFLDAGTNWLQNPTRYVEGPGQAMVDANLRRLSASHGNPISSPTALGIASQAGLQDWRNAWSTAGNLGLGGQDIRANLGTGAARSEADIWGNLAGGVSDLINPRKSLADLMREYSITVGGQRV